MDGSRSSVRPGATLVGVGSLGGGGDDNHFVSRVQQVAFQGLHRHRQAIAAGAVVVGELGYAQRGGGGVEVHLAHSIEGVGGYAFADQRGRDGWADAQALL